MAVKLNPKTAKSAAQGVTGFFDEDLVEYAQQLKRKLPKDHPFNKLTSGRIVGSLKGLTESIQLPWYFEVAVKKATDFLNFYRSASANSGAGEQQKQLEASSVIEQPKVRQNEADVSAVPIDWYIRFRERRWP